MYRIDHLAFRTKDRFATAKFLMDVLGYKLQTEFEIKFDDGTNTKCLALEPWSIVLPDEDERSEVKQFSPEWWVHMLPNGVEYHRPPEYFVSDGPPESIVGQWVKERNGIGGLHHIAFQCDSVVETMEEWKQKGYAEFTTETPLSCPNLVQCFTKPSNLTGVIFELIQRGKHGFCGDNVKDLISSTRGL